MNKDNWWTMKNEPPLEVAIALVVSIEDVLQYSYFFTIFAATLRVIEDNKLQEYVSESLIYCIGGEFSATADVT